MHSLTSTCSSVFFLQFLPLLYYFLWGGVGGGGGCGQVDISFGQVKFPTYLPVNWQLILIMTDVGNFLTFLASIKYPPGVANQLPPCKGGGGGCSEISAACPQSGHHLYSTNLSFMTCYVEWDEIASSVIATQQFHQCGLCSEGCSLLRLSRAIFPSVPAGRRSHLNGPFHNQDYRIYLM